MPLRKSGPLVGSTFVAVALSAALLPSTASAGLFSSLFGGSKTSATGTTVTQTTTTTSSSTSTASTAAPGCTPLPTTKAFQKVDGDTADYSLGPDGGFENGGAGWTFTGGARVVSGNETLGVSSGKKHLMMPLNAAATSPAFCVDQTQPHFRFVYKVDNASLSGFVAYVVFRDAAGKITNIQLVSSRGISLTPTLWQASPASPLATLIPLDGSTKSASVQLRIIALSPVDIVKDFSDAIIGDNALTSLVASVGGAATGLVGTITGSVSQLLNIGVSIDSVMVDPYRRG